MKLTQMRPETCSYFIVILNRSYKHGKVYPHEHVFVNVLQEYDVVLFSYF